MGNYYRHVKPITHRGGRLVKFKGRVASIAPYAVAASLSASGAIACAPSGDPFVYVGIDVTQTCTTPISHNLYVGWTITNNAFTDSAAPPILALGPDVVLRDDVGGQQSGYGPFEIRLNNGAILVIEDGVSIDAATEPYSDIRFVIGARTNTNAPAWSVDTITAPYEIVLKSGALMDQASRPIAATIAGDGSYWVQPNLTGDVLFTGRYSPNIHYSPLPLADYVHDVLTFDGATNALPFTFGYNLVIGASQGASAYGFGTVQALNGADVLIGGSPFGIDNNALNPAYVPGGSEPEVIFRKEYRNLLHLPSYGDDNGGLRIDATSTVRLHSPADLSGLDHYGERGLVLVGNVHNLGTLRLDDQVFNYLHISKWHQAIEAASEMFETLYGAGSGTLGNYSGGGTIRMDVQLEGDDSAHDTLLIDGDISGVTRIDVINVGGAGAQTIDGIPLIFTSGDSTGAFVIGQAATAGAYVYNVLERRTVEDLPDQEGNILSMGKGSEISDVWFLMSQAAEDEPMYQPSVVAAETLPTVLEDLNKLGSSRLRREQRIYTAPQQPELPTIFCKDAAQGFVCPVTPDQNDYFADKGKIGAASVAVGPWLELSGGRMSLEKLAGSGALTSPTLEQTRTGLTVGYDFVLAETANGTIVAGGFLGYQSASASVSSYFGSGDIETEGYGIGASLAYLSNSGFYVDGQIRLSQYDSAYQLATGISSSSASDIKADGLAVALEIGQRFDLRDDLSLTPYAQLHHSALSYQPFTDQHGAQIRIDDSSRTDLRLGLDANLLRVSAAGSVTSFSLGTSVQTKLSGSSAASVSGLSLRSDSPDTLAGVRAQFSHSWAENKRSIFADLGYDRAIGAASLKGDDLNLRLGLNLRW